MSDIAISVENISKRYRLGASGGPSYHRLSEMISGVPRALWNYGRTTFKSSKHNTGEAESANKDEFWALKDVSFEVKQGEVVGIIGRNGAGKSTLLKILSRITEPTSGRFGVRGRVASLLEVGTGFHPELTGRENIYVSGITLGMTRAEIKKRFDEIVDFSGVEKFLDTPVKQYSSGMQVRLGFAVAAHLESEILLVDEVLAVGDFEFQRKCKEKIAGVRNSGRTLFLVSHNMSSILELCNRSLLLQGGIQVFSGDSKQAIELYAKDINDCTTAIGSEDDNHGICAHWSFYSSENERIHSIAPTESSILKFRIRNAGRPKIDQPRVAFAVDNSNGVRLFHFDNTLLPTVMSLGSANYEVTLEIAPMYLMPGTYFGSLYISDGPSIVEWHKQSLVFEVAGKSPYPSGTFPDRDQACLCLPFNMSVEPVNA